MESHREHSQPKAANDNDKITREKVRTPFTLDTLNDAVVRATKEHEPQIVLKSLIDAFESDGLSFPEPVGERVANLGGKIAKAAQESRDDISLDAEPGEITPMAGADILITLGENIVELGSVVQTNEDFIRELKKIKAEIDKISSQNIKES